MKILVVDDEKTIVKGIKFNLENEGYEVDACYDGEAAVELARSGDYAVILLDLMMPKVDGLEACQQIRQFSTVPIIMITARSEHADKLMGFESGADDYITKPFNILEMVERVNAVLRRARKTEDVVSFGDVTADFSKRRVLKGGEEVHLKPKEFDLLEALVVNRNLALSREKLIELVWPMDFDGDERTVDIHVRRLRQKLGLEDRLITVFKTGYRLQI